MAHQPFFAVKNPGTGRSAPDSRGSSGFTIVEVLVSAILFTICILAVSVIVRVGTQLQVSDNNHRQARTILRSIFENEYHFRQFNTIPDSSVSVNIIDIDPLESNVVQGELTKRTSSGFVTSASGTMVPVKTIMLVLKWNEIGSMAADTIPRSITLYKLLAAVQ